MPQDRPSASELLDAVGEFLKNEILPAVQGSRAFHTRVAMNVLGIVARELEYGPKFDAEEHQALETLLGQKGPIEDLKKELARRIKSGEFDERRQEVLEHLRKIVRRKLEIANPRYLEDEMPS